ncbi:MAG: homoaconitate hydratase [bacterium]|nr:homoaconitate hydratase [bacterium]
MIEILDTTLRDGEQTPGVCFSAAEKLEIARRISALGVTYIEAGTPAMGPEEQAAVTQIVQAGLSAKIVTWNRAQESDLIASLETGSKHIHLSLPVSEQLIAKKLGKDRQFVLDRLKSCFAFLAGQGALEISVGAEDASRAEPEFVKEYALLAQELGACRVRLCDTLGVLSPFNLAKTFEPTVKALKVALEIHTHNDFGMATANALAAAHAGFTVLDTTVLGLGERAGNAALEELALVLMFHLNQPSIQTQGLKSLAAFVAQAAMRPIPFGKSIVGERIFYHESGIHADGVIKDPLNYEPFAPELVGAHHEIVIGKHSGRHSLAHKLTQLGLSAQHAEGLMESVRGLANAKKGLLSDQDLMTLDQQLV